MKPFPTPFPRRARVWRLDPRWLILFFGVLGLSACAAPTPEPTATPSPPTRTPKPAATLAATPRPPVTTCPLTGLPLNGTHLDDRRPLLIKIGNSAAERPQSGLAQADVVFEHLTEGGITRFGAVFYCQAADDIGPIRSARLIDLELAPMFDAIFAHVGGSPPVREQIANSEVSQADIDDYGRAPIFREIATRKRPFNRYSSTGELWQIARERGWIPGRGVDSRVFAAKPPAGGRTTGTITIPYSADASVTYTFDADSGRYLRAVGGAPHLDAVSGQQLAAGNVVVLYAVHETTDIVEDSLGSRSVKIILTGSGRATLFRDGQAFDAKWSRSDPRALLEFTDARGQPLALKPGPTWFEVVPPDMQVQ